jgi:hypothetical protein
MGAKQGCPEHWMLGAWLAVYRSNLAHMSVKSLTRWVSDWGWKVRNVEPQVTGRLGSLKSPDD